LQMHSILVVPLATADAIVLGAITLVSSESRRLFTKEDLDVAGTVAKRVALAITNARMFQTQRRAAEALRFTGQVNQLLFETGDPWQAMERVAWLVATEVADACAILRLHGDTVRTEILAHRDPKVNAAIAPLRGHRTLRLQPERELAERLKQHQTIVLTADSARLKERSWPYLSHAIDALNAHSTIVVPWHAGSATYGALVAHYSAPSVDATDVALLEEVARRASVAVERAEAHDRERKIATTLQQASLPALIAEPDGLTFDAVYAPAGEEAEVGGDWYDAIELDDGSVVVSVGDVTGRGIQAAAIMSKVRHAMGMAPLHEMDPTKILDAAGWFLGKRYPDAIVTAFVGVISRDRQSMRFANAGHPLPILRRDGRLIELQATGLPLGLRHLAKPEPSAEIALCDGDIILFFTDGLIEGRREWDVGETLLRSVLQSSLFTASTAPAKLVARTCLPAMLHDDVAILSVSVGSRRCWSLSLDDARAAWDARSHFVEFLRGIEGGSRFLNTAELIFGELLGNVVCHAPGPVEVSVDCYDDALVVHVIDSGPPIEVTDWHLPEDTLSERGRGLYIVAKLAADLRIEHVANYGNHISVTMPR
jgi:serine phosphatase RsbU (regulator of sigma subunit)/anti-sigma regulatory factor (Ser/Thr protein kinase)